MAQVTVYETRKREDGSVHGIGNSIEVEVSEAIQLIQSEDAIAFGYALGVVPPEFLDEVE